MACTLQVINLLKSLESTRPTVQYNRTDFYGHVAITQSSCRRDMFRKEIPMFTIQTKQDTSAVFECNTSQQNKSLQYKIHHALKYFSSYRINHWYRLYKFHIDIFIFNQRSWKNMGFLRLDIEYCHHIAPLSETFCNWGFWQRNITSNANMWPNSSANRIDKIIPHCIIRGYSKIQVFYWRKPHDENLKNGLNKQQCYQETDEKVIWTHGHSCEAVCLNLPIRSSLEKPPVIPSGVLFNIKTIHTMPPRGCYKPSFPYICGS